LASAREYATIIEAVEAVSTGNARYIGVRLNPIIKEPAGCDSTTQAKQRKAVRSNADVEL